MQVPELPAGDSPQAQVPPAHAPARSGAVRLKSRAGRGSAAKQARGGATGRRKPGSGAHRTTRSSRGEKEGGVNPAFIARIAVGLIVVAIVSIMYFTGGTDWAAVFTRGVEAMQKGRHELAIEHFETVPEGHNLYSRAQENLVNARELMAAEVARRDSRKADNLWNIVEQMRRDYVERKGPSHPEYAPNCRYMLKRAQEFIDTFPADPRAEQVRGLFPYYSLVANLVDPPTEADLRAEVYMRTQTWNYKAALEPIVEYAERTGETEVAREITEEVREAARARWVWWIKKLTGDGSLDEGDENWRRISNSATKFLTNVEGLSGVSADAIALRDKADAALDAGG